MVGYAHVCSFTRHLLRRILPTFSLRISEALARSLCLGWFCASTYPPANSKPSEPHVEVEHCFYIYAHSPPRNEKLGEEGEERLIGRSFCRRDPNRWALGTTCGGG